MGKERGQLELVVNTINELTSALADASDLLEMAVDEDDDETVATIEEDLLSFEKKVAALEFQRMFAGEMVANNAFLDIQAG